MPTDESLADGVRRVFGRRVLADRLPQAVVGERRVGYQAIDWHEGLMAADGEIADKLAGFARRAPAAEMLDLERLQGLIRNWPTSGWDRKGVIEACRPALLRGISAGHFLRKASGSN